MQRAKTEEEKPEEEETEKEEEETEGGKTKVAAAGRTVEAYKNMADALRSKGYKIPQQHGGALGVINQMLRDKGLSFKNGDWKNYAGMNAVLQQAYPEISQAEPEEEVPQKGPLGSLSDEELAQKIADRKEAERQKKLKNWRPPARRGPGIPTPRDNIKSSRPGSIQLQETMRQMIMDHLKSNGEFKHFFKESPESKVVNNVVENLMKHDYFKDLAKKKILKEEEEKPDLTAGLSDDQLKKMIGAYMKKGGRSPEQVKTILNNAGSTEELQNLYKGLRKGRAGKVQRQEKEKQASKKKKGNRTVEAYKDMGNMLAKKGHDVPKGHKGRLQYIKKILDKAGKKAGKDFKSYGQMQAVLAAAVGADMGFAAHDAKKAKDAKEHPGAVADAPSKRNPLPNAWKNRLMQLIDKPDSVLKLTDHANKVMLTKLIQHKELFQDQSGYENLMKIMRRKYELRKGQDETEKAGLKDKSKPRRKVQPKYFQTGPEPKKSRFAKGIDRFTDKVGKGVAGAAKKVGKTLGMTESETRTETESE